PKPRPAPASSRPRAGPGAGGRGPAAPPDWWMSGAPPPTGGPTPSGGPAPAGNEAPGRPVLLAGEADVVGLVARAGVADAAPSHVIDRVPSEGTAGLLTDPLGEALATPWVAWW